MTITLPEGYEYVASALMSTVWVLAYQVILVSKFRKSSGIEYPQLYAEKTEAQSNPEAKKFNCAQRAHQNTLENLPLLVIPSLIAGLRYPLVTAAACSLWSIARVSYTRGYVTGDPKNRVTTLYRASGLGTLGLIFTATYIAGEWVVAGISKAIQ